MYQLKKLIKVLVCFILMNWSLSVGANDFIKIGVIVFPPHVEVRNGKVEGKLIKYVSRVLEGINVKYKFINYPSARALNLLKIGKIELLLPIIRSDKTRRISVPLFYSTPGLCFKKDQFIPILSADDRLKNLIILYPVGMELVPILESSKERLRPIHGSNVLERGIKMLSAKRADAFYHPSARMVYNMKNPYYKKIACSYFYGHSSPVSILVYPSLADKLFRKINKAFVSASRDKSYEYYFSEDASK